MLRYAGIAILMIVAGAAATIWRMQSVADQRRDEARRVARLADETAMSPEDRLIHRAVLENDAFAAKLARCDEVKAHLSIGNPETGMVSCDEFYVTVVGEDDRRRGFIVDPR